MQQINLFRRLLCTNMDIIYAVVLQKVLYCMQQKQEEKKPLAGRCLFRLTSCTFFITFAARAVTWATTAWTGWRRWHICTFFWFVHVKTIFSVEPAALDELNLSALTVASRRTVLLSRAGVEILFSVMITTDVPFWVGLFLFSSTPNAQCCELIRHALQSKQPEEN